MRDKNRAIAALPSHLAGAGCRAHLRRRTQYINRCRVHFQELATLALPYRYMTARQMEDRLNRPADASLPASLILGYPGLAGEALDPIIATRGECRAELKKACQDGLIHHDRDELFCRLRAGSPTGQPRTLKSFCLLPWRKGGGGR